MDGVGMCVRVRVRTRACRQCDINFWDIMTKPVYCLFLFVWNVRAIACDPVPRV